MMARAMLILSLSSLCLFLGCQGSCIRVGGAYKDFAGDVTYCFDQKESEKTGVPVFEESGDGGGSSIFGFNLDQVRRIWDRLRGGENASGVSARSVHPVSGILEAIGD